MSGPMNAEAGLSCPHCATPRDIYRYCMNCGFDFSRLAHPSVADETALVEAEYAAVTDDADPNPVDRAPHHTVERPPVAAQPPVVPPPAAESSLPLVGGASAPVMVGIAAAALCILLLIGAAMVSVLGDDDPPATRSPDATSTASDASEKPSQAPGEPRCWDGSSANSLSDCTEPRGTVGLAWVFPSFIESQCTNKSPNGAKPAKWSCRVAAPQGGRVTIRYREHTSVKRALATYDRGFGRGNRTTAKSPRDDIERYLWRARRAGNTGAWTVTSLYADYPWAVTVKGRSRDAVDDAFSNVVEFRNPRRIIGQPAEG